MPLTSTIFLASDRWTVSHFGRRRCHGRTFCAHRARCRRHRRHHHGTPKGRRTLSRPRPPVPHSHTHTHTYTHIGECHEQAVSGGAARRIRLGRHASWRQGRPAALRRAAVRPARALTCHVLSGAHDDHDHDDGDDDDDAPAASLVASTCKRCSACARARTPTQWTRSSLTIWTAHCAPCCCALAPLRLP
jgi:hypothetical protein